MFRAVAGHPADVPPCWVGSYQALPVPFGEHLDQAFDGFQTFRVRDLPQGLNDPATLFQESDGGVHVETFEVATGFLGEEQFFDFRQGEGRSALGVLVDPLDQFGECGTFPEQAEGFGGGGELAVHACQQALQRQVPQLTDGQAQSFRTLADGGVAELALELPAENVANRVAVEPGNAGKILLIPTFLFHQAGNFAGQFGSFLGSSGHPWYSLGTIHSHYKAGPLSP